MDRQVTCTFLAPERGDRRGAPARARAGGLLHTRRGTGHAYSNELYPKLEELTGQYVSWHSSGGIRLALTQDDLDWFGYLKGIADNVGFMMEVIDPANR